MKYNDLRFLDIVIPTSLNMTYDVSIKVTYYNRRQNQFCKKKTIC